MALSLVLQRLFHYVRTPYKALVTGFNGNFAIITSGRYEILYLSIPLLALTYLFANHFTIVGMGKDFTNNLGLSYEN